MRERNQASGLGNESGENRCRKENDQQVNSISSGKMHFKMRFNGKQEAEHASDKV